MHDANDPPSPPGWRRARFALQLLGLLLLCLAAAGCGASATTTAAVASTASPVPTVVEESSVETSANSASSIEESTAEVEAQSTSETEPGSTPTPHPIAAADTELPPAPIGFDNLFEVGPTGPQPISIEIENIDVTSADVIPVGVNEDLTFEVPPADQVGWYEFGAAPGEAGSAVLAAHIAYNGVDGVFRYLEDVEIGSVVVVGFDDGTSQRYRIEEVTEYVKEALPDSLWARDGREQLALITCGGTFNYQLDSYESNTVAIAVPI